MADNLSPPFTGTGQAGAPIRAKDIGGGGAGPYLQLISIVDIATGNVPQFGPLTYGGSGSATVGTSSGTIVSAGTYTRALTIATLPTSASNVWLNPTGAAAVVGTGILVAQGGGSFTFGGLMPVPTAAITAITDSGSSQTVTLAGG